MKCWWANLKNDGRLKFNMETRLLDAKRVPLKFGWFEMTTRTIVHACHDPELEVRIPKSLLTVPTIEGGR